MNLFYTRLLKNDKVPLYVHMVDKMQVQRNRLPSALYCLSFSRSSKVKYSIDVKELGQFEELQSHRKTQVAK